MIVGVTQHVKTLSHVCKYAAHHVEREHIVLAIACWDKGQIYEHTCTIIVQCINMQGMILSWQLYVNQNKNHIAHLLLIITVMCYSQLHVPAVMVHRTYVLTIFC